MNGREALKALADGKRVRRVDWEAGQYISLDMAEEWSFHSEDLDGTLPEWEVLKAPATDAELVAEMERLDLANQRSQPNMAKAYDHCARMLRRRKVGP
jgi:hypothetical protein